MAELAALQKASPPPYPFVHGYSDSQRIKDIRIAVRGEKDNLGDVAPRRFLQILTKGEAQEFYTCSGDGTDPHHLAFDHDVVVFTDWQDFRSIYRWNGVDISRDDEVECD